MSLSLVVNSPSACKTFAFNAPLCALNWADLYGKDISYDSKKIFSNSSFVLSLVEIPKKFSKLESSLNSVRELEGFSDGVEKVVDLFRRLMVIFAGFAAGVQIALEENLLYLSEGKIKILNAVCFLSSVALTLHSAKKLRKNLTLLSQVEGDRGLLFLKTVSRICSLTTGIFGMLFFAFGEAMIAKWAVLGVSTVSLSTSIFKYYHKNLV